MFNNNTKETVCDGCGSKENLQKFTSVGSMLSKNKQQFWDYCPKCFVMYQIDGAEGWVKVD